MKNLIFLSLLMFTYTVNAELTPLYTNANRLQGKDVSATAPSSGEVLTWNSTTSAWTPAAGGGGGGSGTVTSVVGGTGLTGGNITTTGTLAVDVGVTTGKIIQVAASNKLPVIDGSNLTNIVASPAFTTGLSVTQSNADTPTQFEALLLSRTGGSNASATQNRSSMITMKDANGSTYIAGVEGYRRDANNTWGGGLNLYFNAEGAQANAISDLSQGISLKETGAVVLGGYQGGTVQPSASLQVLGTTRGFLPPVLTTTQRNAISSPATGLMVFNSTDAAYNFYDGAAWTAMGGGAIPSLTAGSVLFSNGTTIAQDNTNFFWDDTNKTLSVGDTSSYSSSNIKLSTAMALTDPIGDFATDHGSRVSMHFTDDGFLALYNDYADNKLLIDDTKTVGGGNINYGGHIDRSDAADLGHASFLAGSYNYLTQSDGAKISDFYAGYITGNNTVSDGTVGAMYDFYAMPSSLTAGTVTNRYGVYIDADSGYTKKNWLSGNLVVGGTSYSAPSVVLDVKGDMSATISTTDTPVNSGIFTATSNTTVDGSIDTNAIQLNAQAIVQAGATNDKATNGIQNFVTRGDGTDTGTLSGLTGLDNAIQINSDSAGVTSFVAGVLTSTNMTSGIVTDLYDFLSFRNGSGTVVNHYGVYISDDSTTPVKNYLSGQTQVGGSSVSIAASASLDLGATDKALLLNRLDTTAEGALTAANGMMIYNTTSNKFRCRENGAWADCLGGGGGGANVTLSNLTNPTAVNQDLLFGGVGTWKLGTPTQATDVDTPSLELSTATGIGIATPGGILIRAGDGDNADGASISIASGGSPAGFGGGVSIAATPGFDGNHTGSIGLNTSNRVSILNGPFQLWNHGSDPTNPTPTAGDSYWNTATLSVRIYDGTTWGDVGIKPHNAHANSSTTTITSSLATIVWSNEDYDTDSALASGLFTCPVTGKWQVNTAVALSGTFALNSVTTMQVKVDTSISSEKVHYSGGAVTNEEMAISDMINCSAGNVISVQVSSTGTSPAIVSSSSRNYFSVNWVAP